MTPEENIDFRKEIIRKKFIEYVGYEPNLDNPKTFNEKLQWLKLYYHDPLMTKCADKYAVREYIKETIGEEYLIPLIGVWDRVEDIDFDLLPNQFVLKVNWGSGMNIIVKDKNKLDVGDTKKKLSSYMKPSSNHYYTTYEWPYKNIKQKIICENYMCNKNEDNLIVYKIFCFNSEPYLFQVIINDKTKEEKINYYDLNWNKLSLEQTFKNFDYELPRPNNLDLMLKLSKQLSRYLKYFIRIDFYEINNKLYFSEYTFYSDSGLAKFTPDYWDLNLGNLIKLPKEKRVEYDFIDKDTLLNQVTNLEPIVKEVRDLEEKNTYLKNVLKDVKKENKYLNQTLKDKYEELERLYKNKTLFNLLSIFNFSLFSFNIDEKYIKIIILGIKIIFKRRPDQTRPDQT